jgi:hypothetical protein
VGRDCGSIEAGTTAGAVPGQQLGSREPPGVTRIAPGRPVRPIGLPGRAPGPAAKGIGIGIGL